MISKRAALWLSRMPSQPLDSSPKARSGRIRSERMQSTSLRMRANITLAQ